MIHTNPNSLYKLELVKNKTNREGHPGEKPRVGKVEIIPYGKSHVLALFDSTESGGMTTSAIERTQSLTKKVIKFETLNSVYLLTELGEF